MYTRVFILQQNSRVQLLDIKILELKNYQFEIELYTNNLLYYFLVSLLKKMPQLATGYFKQLKNNTIFIQFYVILMYCFSLNRDCIKHE